MDSRYLPALPLGLVIYPCALADDLEATQILNDLNVSVLTPEPGQQGATGGVEFSLDKNIHRVAFSAILHLDGRSFGEIETVVFPPQGPPPTPTHWDVVCLAVEANRALLVGAQRPQDPTLPLSPGNFILVGVTDNGEGAPDPKTADTIQFLPSKPSFFDKNLEAREVCALAGAAGGATPISKGNIQVQP